MHHIPSAFTSHDEGSYTAVFGIELPYNYCIYYIHIGYRADRPARRERLAVLRRHAGAGVQKYVTLVRDLVASTNGVLYVEQRVPIDHLTDWAPPARPTA